MNKDLLTKESSQQLALLKLCACIGVVYIHSYMVHFNYFTINSESLPLVYYVQTILSQYIARVAVPVFFAVSGYIYAAKQYSDNNWQFFCRKVRGILWPYLLWNSITLGYIFLAQIPGDFRRYFSAHLLISDFTAARWVEAYAGWSNSWFPFLYPLWFMPYLFAAFLLVHFMRKWLSRATWLIAVLTIFNIVFASVICIRTYLVSWGPFLRLLYAVSFFTLGMLLVRYQQSIRKKSTLFIGIGVFIAATVIDLIGWTPSIKWNMLAWYAGLIVMFSLTGRIGKCSEKFRSNMVFFSGFSFLIYVAHEYMLTGITKLIYPAIPANSFYILAVYLFLPIVLISVLITGGWVLKKLLPKLYDFLFNAR